MDQIREHGGVVTLARDSPRLRESDRGEEVGSNCAIGKWMRAIWLVDGLLGLFGRAAGQHRNSQHAIVEFFAAGRDLRERNGV